MSVREQRCSYVLPPVLIMKAVHHAGMSQEAAVMQQNGAKNEHPRLRFTSKDEEMRPGNVPLKGREKCRIILPQFDFTLDGPVDAVFKSASAL